MKTKKPIIIAIANQKGGVAKQQPPSTSVSGLLCTIKGAAY